jgi:hypothetical protein
MRLWRMSVKVTTGQLGLDRLLELIHVDATLVQLVLHHRIPHHHLLSALSLHLQLTPAGCGERGREQHVDERIDGVRWREGIRGGGWNERRGVFDGPSVLRRRQVLQKGEEEQREVDTCH